MIPHRVRDRIFRPLEALSSRPILMFAALSSPFMWADMFEIPMIHSAKRFLIVVGLLVAMQTIVYWCVAMERLIDRGLDRLRRHRNVPKHSRDSPTMRPLRGPSQHGINRFVLRYPIVVLAMTSLPLMWVGSSEVSWNTIGTRLVGVLVAIGATQVVITFLRDRMRLMFVIAASLLVGAMLISTSQRIEGRLCGHPHLETVTF